MLMITFIALDKDHYVNIECRVSANVQTAILCEKSTMYMYKSSNTNPEDITVHLELGK